MIQIRENTFETNSSSTHALCMCTQADYNAWLDGKMLFDIDKRTGKSMVTKDEAISYAQQNSRSFAHEVAEYGLDEALRWERFLTSDNYDSRLENECEIEIYDTLALPSGETIVTFGYFGYDG